MTRALIPFLVALLLVPAAKPQTPVSNAVVLTTAVLHRAYFERLPVPAGTAPWAWRVISGALPAGLMLEHNGVISGMPAAVGAYRVTLEATDSSTPPRVLTSDFIINVEPVLVIRWKTSPAVAGAAISGAVEVVNHVGRSVDLTVIVVAVNEFNKAFALGYQHFPLDPGPHVVDFGGTLPRGAYVVHADAVAEVEESNSIYRARLQTSVLNVP